MRAEQETGTPLWYKGLGKQFLRDPFVWVLFSVLLLTISFCLQPFVSPASFRIFAIYYAPIPFLLLSFAAFLLNALDHGYARDRPFWSRMTVAFALLFLASVANAFFRYDPKWGSANLIVQLLTIAYFFFVFLAIQQKQHTEEQIVLDATKRLTETAFLVFCFAILTYFCLIPATLDFASYFTHNSIYAMYLTMDVVALALFGYTAFLQKKVQWKIIYILQAIAFFLWGINDALSLWQSHIPMIMGARLDLFHCSPFLFVILSARTRRVKFEPDRTQAALPISARPVEHYPIILYALILPMMHAFISATSSVGQSTQLARNLLLLWYLPVLSFLAWKETRILSMQKIQSDEEVARLNADLAERVFDLTRANQVRDQFVANTSHELRTPISAVLGMTDMLLTTELDEKQKEYVETTRNAGQTLLTFINEILDFSKIQSGKLTLENKPVNIRGCIQDCIDLLRQEADRKALRINCGIDIATPMMIRTDPARLRQILLNIIGNAVKFTNEGEITVSVGCSTAPDSTIELRFSIQDTGIGIPEGQMSLLFQPFSQVDSSYTRRRDGTGLGLVISKQLCEAMGGSISVESQYGVGTTFHFTIRAEPAMALPYSEIEEPYQAEGVLANKLPLRILLVEDNPVNQQVAAMYLQRLGYHPNLVMSGQQAIDAHSKRDYDIIFMDLQMPDLDGFEATRCIRKLPHGEKPVIIAMTAAATTGDKEKCLAAGMDDHISKPIQLKVLRDVLTHFGRSGRLS